jgi:hypothetical protein
MRKPDTQAVKLVPRFDPAWTLQSEVLVKALVGSAKCSPTTAYD